jgi:hypothetical protein
MIDEAKKEEPMQQHIAEATAQPEENLMDTMEKEVEAEQAAKT